jgi:hypothetical protein
MRKLYSLGFSLLVLAVVILLAQNVFAQPGEGIKYRNWKLHPVASIQEQFDSNIFQEKTSVNKDWITTFRGGFRGEGIVMADTAVSAGYLAEYNLFANYPKQSALNQYANAAINHEFKDITFNVDDEYQHLFSRPDSETTQRVLWNLNNLGFKASAEYNRFGWSAEYRPIYYNYQTEGWQGENRWENDANVVLSYRVYTKTYVFTEINYGNIDYVKKLNSDANFIQGLFGVRGKLTAKLTGTVKAGWQYRGYTRGGVKDYDSPVTMAGLLEEFSDRDKLEINWIRSPYESLYTGTNYYVDNSMALKHTHKFTHKLSGNLGGLYRLSQYPTETLDGGTWKKRLDNTWQVGAGIDYAVQKWLTATARYDFIQRKSNFSSFDYNDNLATVSLNAAY